MGACTLLNIIPISTFSYFLPSPSLLNDMVVKLLIANTFPTQCHKLVCCLILLRRQLVCTWNAIQTRVQDVCNAVAAFCDSFCPMTHTLHLQLAGAMIHLYC